MYTGPRQEKKTLHGLPYFRSTAHQSKHPKVVEINWETQGGIPLLRCFMTEIWLASENFNFAGIEVQSFEERLNPSWPSFYSYRIDIRWQRKLTVLLQNFRHFPRSDLDFRSGICVNHAADILTAMWQDDVPQIKAILSVRSTPPVARSFNASRPAPIVPTPPTRKGSFIRKVFETFEERFKTFLHGANTSKRSEVKPRWEMILPTMFAWTSIRYSAMRFLIKPNLGIANELLTPLWFSGA